MSVGRESLSGKLGFILTTTGAAVGLGCLWRFPNLIAEYGGGLFIIVYAILLATIGATLFITETAIGQKTQTGILGAFKKINPKFRFMGGLTLLICFLMHTYCSVIGGQVLSYSALFATGFGESLAQPDFYNSFTQSFGPLIGVVIYILITSLVVFFGVKKGLERVCKILLPTVLLILIVLIAYCLTLPGAIDGLVYYLQPDFSKFNGELLLAAMGQALYTLSIGIGIVLTLGSYTNKKMDVVNSAYITGLSTLFVAFLSGIFVIPAIYMFTNGHPEIIGSGSIFASLPPIFETMPFGMAIGAIFFILLACAAITSSIASLEVLVLAMEEKFELSRKKAVAIISSIVLVVAIFISLGYGVLSFISFDGMNILEILDHLCGSHLIPISALLMCILVGYCMKSNDLFFELKIFSRYRCDRILRFMIRYVCPVCIVVIFVYGIVCDIMF